MLIVDKATHIRQIASPTRTSRIDDSYAEDALPRCVYWTVRIGTTESRLRRGIRYHCPGRQPVIEVPVRRRREMPLPAEPSAGYVAEPIRPVHTRVGSSICHVRRSGFALPPIMGF